MEHIAKSLAAMILTAIATAIFTLGTCFLVAAYAVFTPSNLGMVSDLLHAGQWLRFAAGVIAIAAVCAACWGLVLRQAWIPALEVAGAFAGTLLFGIGLLMIATSEGSSSAAVVIGAVGLGIWGMLALVRAARMSFTAQRTRNSAGRVEKEQSALWLTAAAGMLILAVGFGLAAGQSFAVVITSSVLLAVGIAAICACVGICWARGYIQSATAPGVLAGLVLLTAALIVFAIASGVLYGSGATLTSIRVWPSVAYTIEFAGFGMLAAAAWVRARDLYRDRAAAGPAEDLGIAKAA
jgi:hypothetical protein